MGNGGEGEGGGDGEGDGVSDPHFPMSLFSVHSDENLERLAFTQALQFDLVPFFHCGHTSLSFGPQPAPPDAEATVMAAATQSNMVQPTNEWVGCQGA